MDSERFLSFFSRILDYSNQFQNLFYENNLIFLQEKVIMKRDEKTRIKEREKINTNFQ